MPCALPGFILSISILYISFTVFGYTFSLLFPSKFCWPVSLDILHHVSSSSLLLYDDSYFACCSAFPLYYLQLCFIHFLIGIHLPLGTAHIGWWIKYFSVGLERFFPQSSTCFVCIIFYVPDARRSYSWLSNLCYAAILRLNGWLDFRWFLSGSAIDFSLSCCCLWCRLPTLKLIVYYCLAYSDLFADPAFHALVIWH